MTTALLLDVGRSSTIDLAGDLAAAGIHVIGAAARGNLVREVSQLGPDVVLCVAHSPDEALFAEFAKLAEIAPCPAIVFTNDPDATRIECALGAGIALYVVNGYAAGRLRPLIHAARTRFEHDRKLRSELAEVTRRYDERKLVDRAKGILMRARQVSEEEAFAVLRAASMHSNQRVGQVSQQVIAAAHYADAVNRAGKLRMLSQRLVKACALCVLDPAAGSTAAQIADSVGQIEANIAALARSLSRPTFGDLLDGVAAAWAALKAAVAQPLAAARVASIDALAEGLLLQAEQLTRQLETAGLVTTLHVINVSGRQRMLSQRHAKQALLALLLGGAQAAAMREQMAATAETFEDAMRQLAAAPLSTPEIGSLLADAARAWDDVTRAARQARSAAGARSLDASSDALLALFETLTDRYERSMQVLMG
ncbi:type IV pili methyl-accepting chemotaxis transducer N-terminal domain-containing protein [Piscinibacter koreensis]|uniref:Type IV pili methyl-accepting chemotaxis transducer N-terminal domain-containing protein n=1 Tax=Piscinibacter koreensis TaxID=2742824 RepID=A0A7Y6TY98_9BURK|nr:type IV pili methyl-accepting chemotaxis transducer N-terminal domain-containing protein [Schlegelella koreensis]NUZ07866.1 type IV pili methyl-accepting chemotaxis transducer N-terminal domain-containing protein [Schlegelella koreensis]